MFILSYISSHVIIFFPYFLKKNMYININVCNNLHSIYKLIKTYQL